MTSPLIVLVASAIIVGLVGSLFILLAIGVDAWQEFTFDSSVFSAYTSNTTGTIYVTLPTQSNWYITFREFSENVWKTTYLYSEYGGAWRLCDTMSDAARSELASVYQYKAKCYNFDYRTSAASCFIVSIIDLVAAAFVGVIALTYKQVAACMVTGVLYCMAVFGLAIFHTKNYYEKELCHGLIELPALACSARNVTISWAVPCAWVGVVISAVASVLWLFLTRALR
ncbi:hypothetical protein KUTeg_003102, partial [Tegillarca granosa]